MCQIMKTITEGQFILVNCQFIYTQNKNAKNQRQFPFRAKIISLNKLSNKSFGKTFQDVKNCRAIF